MVVLLSNIRVPSGADVVQGHYPQWVILYGLIIMFFLFPELNSIKNVTMLKNYMITLSSINKTIEKNLKKN